MQKPQQQPSHRVTVVIDGIARRNTIVENEKKLSQPNASQQLNLSAIPNQIRYEALVQSDP